MMQRPVREMQRDDEERRYRNRISELEEEIRSEPYRTAERSMTITESQMTEVVKLAILKCKEGREFESVVFENPETGSGFMVTLKYKPLEGTK